MTAEGVSGCNTLYCQFLSTEAVIMYVLTGLGGDTQVLKSEDLDYMGIRPAGCMDSLANYLSEYPFTFQGQC